MDNGKENQLTKGQDPNGDRRILSNLQEKNEILAILVSDIHLSHTPPVARSAEPDWYAAMGRQLLQLRKLSRKVCCPIICAGDIFDKANSPPELINFALDNLPSMYAIPGQHDLPYHNIEDKHKSAYWTLVQAEKLIDVTEPMLLPRSLRIIPFPWGSQLKSLPKQDRNSNIAQLAVVHRYLWTGNHKYKDAPSSGSVGASQKILATYDAAVFGDNHKGFMTHVRQKPVMNCGTFYRRKTDEQDYQPVIGLLLRDKSTTAINIVPFAVDVSQDVFLDIEETSNLDMQEVLDELSSVEYHTCDFKETLKHRIRNRENLSAGTKKILLEVMEII